MRRRTAPSCRANNMAQSLEQIRDKLDTAFNAAVSYGEIFKNGAIGPEHLKAAAELAKAIVAVEDKLDQRKAEKNGPKLPGK